MHFFPHIFFLRSTSPQILWFCLFKFWAPPILFSGFVDMFRTTTFPHSNVFFKGIPIRHISGESENLELEALEALEAPVAPNRQDHLKWLLGAFQGRTVTGTVTGTENCSAENVNMSAESFGREGQKVVFFVPLDLKRWT